MVPRRTAFRKRIVSTRAVVLLLACLVMGIYALDSYCKKVFGDFDYRNYYAFYLKDLIWKGMVIHPIVNVLTVREENLATTKLPIWEIQLAPRKLAALTNDLPASGRTYQTGTIIINGTPFPARFRLRGDGFWHWGSKQKSWKIKLKGDRRFEGQREFNLINPRDTTTLVWPLAAHVAGAMGLATPRVQHVHARLNGRYLGLMCLVENLDHDFISHHNLPEGALFEDEALGGPPFYDSWENIDDWNIRRPDDRQERRAGREPDERYEKRLRELLQCSAIHGDDGFFNALETLLDIPHFLRWWAYATILLDTHQDRRHNNRLYLHTASGTFRHIPWDMTVNNNPALNDVVDLSMNPLTERLAQSPYHVYMRNKLIWEALRGPAAGEQQLQWIDAAAERIRQDMYADPYKDTVIPVFPFFNSLRKGTLTSSFSVVPVTNEMFEKETEGIKTFVRERTNYLDRTLSATSVEVFFSPPPAASGARPSDPFTSPGIVSIVVGGHAGIEVKEIRLQFSSFPGTTQPPVLLYGNGSPKRHIRQKGVPVRHGGAGETNTYLFSVDELLLPAREKKKPFGPVPARFDFTLAFEGSAANVPVPVKIIVNGVHPFTRLPITREGLGNLSSGDRGALAAGTFLPHAQPPREIVWEGFKRLEKDFRVKKDEMLIIRPGTRIECSQGVSLVSYGKVLARGTAELPITFTRAPEASSWGVVAIQGRGADGSVFDHAVFEYGSDDELDWIFYMGALSIYNADATISNCLFRFNQGDDALNTKHSHADVTDCTFVDNTSDGYDVDFSDGLIARNLFERNGNDGIDCGTSHPRIRDNRVLNSGDKGISIGERSRPVVEGNLIAHCNVGIAVKDESQPKLGNNTFLSNTVAVSAYQKKKAFGGAHTIVQGSAFTGNTKVSEVDEWSTVSLVDCRVDHAVRHND